jgi:excisionase family DNA binding protein
MKVYAGPPAAARAYLEADRGRADDYYLAERGSPVSGSRPATLPLGDSGQLLTIGQAAEYLGTGQRFVRRLISERRIPYVELGKHVRLERCALDAFVAAGRVPCR